jgi:hypothetical protein
LVSYIITISDNNIELIRGKYMNTDSTTRLALSRVKGTNRAIVAMGYDSIESNIVLSIGEGNKLPDPLTTGSYDLVWWNASDYVNPVNDPYAEIVNCIAKVGDTIIVIRSQNGLAYDKNIFGKTYGIAPLPIGNSKYINNPISSLSYYNIPQPHNHTDGNSGGTLSHTNLSNIGTNTHATIDTHLTNTGSMSFQNGSNVTITGGSITAITDLAVADGGTGVSTLSGIVKGNGTSAFSAASAGTDFVAPNGAITGATNTKITYDAKGLITAGAAATLASADFANQGTTTTLLHGNASGNPSFGAVVTGDITNANITYAKIQNVSATDMLLGRVTAGAGIIEEIACTAAGRSLLSGANAAAQRSTLSLDNVTNVAQMPLSYLSTSTALGTSDVLVPSQNAVKTYADGLVVGLLDYRGAYDASGGGYPTTGGSGTAGAILKGDMWVISVAGTLTGGAIQIGDSLIANVNTPGQTAANWNTLNANVSYAPEDLANKVTSISGSSTDTQYPSAKLVYDQLALKAASSSSTYIGTTAVALNRASAALVLTGITSIDGTAAKSTNIVGGNTTTLLGSIPYQSGVDTTTLLSPNTSTTKKFLRQTGTGTNGAAPAWDTLIAADIPDISATYATVSQVHYVGTTSIAANRSSGALVLTGITSIDGSSATCVGNAASATYATNTTITDDTSTVATMYPTWVTGTGNLPQKISSTKLTFNPSTGTLAATIFSGTLSGTITCSIVSTTAPYSALSSDYTIIVSSAGTITIPTATGNTGKIYNIKHNASSGTVAITSTSNIDAALTYNMLTRYETVCIQSNGSQWFVI